MAPSTQDAVAPAQSQSGVKRKKNKHKGGAEDTRQNLFPNVDKKERKRLKNARMKAEQERKKAGAARLKNLRQGELTVGEVYWDADSENEKARGGERHDVERVETAQVVAGDALIDGTQTQDSGACEIREKKKKIKSQRMKHKLDHAILPESLEIDPSFEEQAVIDTPEALENQSMVTKKKHKLDVSDLPEARNFEAVLPLIDGAAGEDEAPKKKRKTKKSKFESYINENQADHRTVLCDRCGTIGHYPEACVLGVVCFNCKHIGHTTKDCVHENKCHICHGEGHVAADCSVLIDHTLRNSTSNTREVIMIVDSPSPLPNKQSQDSSLDLDNVPQHDTFMEDKTIENVEEKKEKMFSIPARFFAPDFHLTRDGQLLASSDKYFSAKSQYPTQSASDDGSSDKRNNHMPDIKPTNFLRTSSFMSVRQESPIVSLGKAYRRRKDGSPSPGARVTPGDISKENRIVHQKRMNHVEEKKANMKKKKSRASSFAIKEVEVNSLDVNNDSDGGESFQLQSQRKEISKTNNRKGVSTRSLNQSVKDVTYVSSDHSSGSDSNLTIQQKKNAKQTPVLPSGKKETPIPPPKPLTLFRNPTTHPPVLKSTPKPVPAPKLGSANSTSIRQTAVQFSTTPILPPAVRYSNSVLKSNNKVLPPNWMTTKLARMNSKIKDDRALEDGWDRSPRGSGLKRGFATTNDKSLLQLIRREAKEPKEELKSQEMKIVADDWEKNPGRVRENAADDDGDILESIAYSSSYLSSKPHGINIASSAAQTTFIKLQLSASASPHALSHLYPDELMICSVMNAKVEVTLNKTMFVVGKGGMWRVRGGEECTIRHARKAGKDASVIGIVIREGEKGKGNVGE